MLLIHFELCNAFISQISIIWILFSEVVMLCSQASTRIQNYISLHKHCELCFHSNKFDQIRFVGCSKNEDCPIVSCDNNCGFSFHECKRAEHLENTCPNETLPCINECNGCQLKVLRKDRGIHLESCVASVIRCNSLNKILWCKPHLIEFLWKIYLRCNSYRVRSLLNNQHKFSKLKWPDPIENQKSQLVQNDATKPSTNINNILLDQDLQSLSKFAENEPLRFHRLYGYSFNLSLFCFFKHKPKLDEIFWF